MNRKKITDILNGFEEEHPVDEWIIDGIHVWPMIKIDLFFRWLRKTDKRYSDTENDALINTSTLKKVFLTLKSIINLIIFLFRTPRKHEHVLFVESSAHRSIVDSQKRNRFYHALVKRIQNYHSGVEILFINEGKLIDNYPTDENILFTDKYYLALRLFFFRKKRDLNKKFSNYEDLIKVFGNDGYQVIDEKPYINEISREFISLKGQVFFARTLIKKYKVKVIFELCYYSNVPYGVNVAAKELFVNTIELQHGGMGPEHISYSGWSKFPENGYNLLPSTIWLWDEVSYDLVNQWVINQDYHQCVLGGNPWFSFLFNSQKKNTNEFPSDKKIILYTIQTYEIESFILKAIQNTPSCYQWWIRMHPNRLSARGTIIKQLMEYDIYNEVVLDKATELPLPTILINASIHVSGFSGSIIEAALLGKFSVILDEVGVSNYRKQIDEGLAIADLSKDPNVLVANIKHYTTVLNNNDSYPADLHESYKKIIDDLLDKNCYNYDSGRVS